MTIPIALQHYNEPRLLLRTVEAIVHRTTRPFRLFVVDNASPQSEEVEAALQLVALKYAAVVIRNPRNNWVYGFNLALDHPAWPASALCAFSDADVIVPEIGGTGDCWLSYLMREMAAHRCIGKLGLSLDLTNLAANPNLKDTYEKEARFLQGDTIGTNIVAPVDTTMALYRRDLFVTRFRFSIGHASLVKPHYYVCRTNPTVSAIHLGWEYYPGEGAEAYDDTRLWRKAVTFSRFGAIVEPAVLSRLSLPKRAAVGAIRLATRAYFGLRVAVLMAAYLLRHFPRRINELQAASR